MRGRLVNTELGNLRKKAVKGGEAVPVHAIKASRKCGGAAPLILNLGTRWVSG